MAIITTETRLDMRGSPEIIAYAKEYRTDYGRMQRYVWRRILQEKGKPDKSKLNTEMQKTFGVLKRTANSVISDMQGRFNSLKELKQTERYQKQQRIEALEEQIARLKKTVNNLAEKAARNQLSEEQLTAFRNQKKLLYYKKQRLQKWKDRLAQLEKDIADCNYRMGFGGKKYFGSQHRLTENGFRSHEGWYHDFVRWRDANIYYLGSKDESCGNQMFHLEPEEDGLFRIRIRKDGKYAAKEQYVYGRCRFSYMADEIRKVITGGTRPIHYRLKLRGTKVYLQAIFTLDTEAIPVVTRQMDGCIGLDFNDGHIELAETDSKGNLVQLKTYPLRFHGTGGKARNEMRTVISEIGKYARMAGKDIVKEDLSFVKKKSKSAKAKSKSGKDYNRMIHTLDYKRYEDALKNMTTRYGVGLIEVNPAYTSKIARQKYCNLKKLTVHSGAAYVIARRGQGYTDHYMAV